MKRIFLVAGVATAMAVGATSVANASTPAGTTTSVNGVTIGPGGSQAMAVNAKGDVIGETHKFTKISAFLWHAGKRSYLGFLFGGDVTLPFGLDDHGDVVGQSGPGSGTMHAFMWHGGKMTDLGSLDGLGGESCAYAINDNGQIVGSTDDAHRTVAFVWRNGTMTALPDLGGYTAATGENAVGQVIGYGQAPGGQDHALLWTSGKMVDLGPGQAMAIDNSGQVLVVNDPQLVGEAGPLTASVWLNGTTTPLPSTVYAVNGMNDNGQVIGYYNPPNSSDSHGFVWQNGTLTDLGADFPVAINDNDQILATTQDANYNTLGIALDHGTTITLVPAAGSVAAGTAMNNNGLIAGTTGRKATVWQLPAAD